MTTQFEIRRADDEALLTRVVIKYVNLDRATGKAAVVPATVREAVGAFEGQVVTR